jgi:hypothetical protein
LEKKFVEHEKGDDITPFDGNKLGISTWLDIKLRVKEMTIPKDWWCCLRSQQYEVKLRELGLAHWKR